MCLVSSGARVWVRFVMPLQSAPLRWLRGDLGFVLPWRVGFVLSWRPESRLLTRGSAAGRFRASEPDPRCALVLTELNSGGFESAAEGGIVGGG